MADLLTLCFGEDFPDEKYAGQEIVLDPAERDEVSEVEWRFGRWAKGNPHQCDVLFSDRGRAEWIGRTQMTLRFDRRDRTWHVHDGVFVLNGEGRRWRYSSSPTLVNDKYLGPIDWHALKFDDGDGHPVAPVISFDCTPGAVIHALKHTGDKIPLRCPAKKVSGGGFRDKEIAVIPWWGALARDAWEWVQSPQTFWGTMYRLILIAIAAVVTVLILGSHL